jgi:hypothetical protein
LINGLCGLEERLRFQRLLKSRRATIGLLNVQPEARPDEAKDYEALKR